MAQLFPLFNNATLQSATRIIRFVIQLATPVHGGNRALSAIGCTYIGSALLASYQCNKTPTFIQELEQEKNEEGQMVLKALSS